MHHARAHHLQSVPATDEPDTRWTDSVYVRTGVTLTGIAVTLQTVVYLASALTAKRTALDVNAEQNIFAWAQSMTIFATAIACLLLVLAGRGRMMFLIPLMVLVAFLSLDEAVAVHERVGLGVAGVLGLSASWDSVIWPVVYLPLTGAVFVLIVATSRKAPRAVSLLVLIGLGCLVAAVVAEVISAPFSTAEGQDGLVNTFESAIEEGLEFGGWGLIATGLLAFGIPGAARLSAFQSSVK